MHGHSGQPHDYRGSWKLYKDDEKDGDVDPLGNLDGSEVYEELEV